MTQWTEYVHYRCENCSEICINHSSTDRAELSVCVDCYRDLPDSLLASALEGTQSPAAPAATRARLSGAPTRDDRREDPPQRDNPEPTGSPERGRGAARPRGNSDDSSSESF